MRKLAFLVDSERLFDKSTIAVALKARLDPPEEAAIEPWLDHCIVVAKDRLLIEDARFVADHKEIDPEDKRLESYSFLLNMPPNRIMPALVAFNRLDFPPREAFFRLLIEDVPVEDCLKAGLGPPELLRERCMLALRTVLLEPLEKEGLL